MILPAAEAIPFLFHQIELRKEGQLVAKLSDREAENLCRIGFVEGIFSARRDPETGEKVPVLRYLQLIVTLRKLKTVLQRVSVKVLSVKAEDSKTFMRTKFGVFHDRRKCREYAGGVTRLLPITVG